MVVTSRFTNPADLREQPRTRANETKTETTPPDAPPDALFDYLARPSPSLSHLDWADQLSPIRAATPPALRQNRTDLV